MTKMMSRFLLLFLTVILVFDPALAQAKANPRYASIIMDAETGMILEQQNADKALHPASLTKIMTLLMLFEAVEQGRLDMNSRIPVSRHAASMVPSKLNLPPGSSIRVKDAIKALVTKSANDVAAAIAEKIGGSERGFANMMNRKAIQIGMTRTTFKNASGLHDPRQVSTARDMAKLARYVITAYPSYYKYFSLQNFSYNGKSYHNHNRLLGKYAGMDGMKTGYVAASGFNLVASAVQGDRRIIAVVFGGRTSRTRNAHMEVLLDRGFSKINKVRIARAMAPLPQRKPVVLEAIAALNKAGADAPERIASINPVLVSGFKDLIGEGDFDPAVSARIETGLLAIAAHKGGRAVTEPSAYIQQAALKIPARVQRGQDQWSVQVGAFNSRAVTDSFIHQTLKRLPAEYAGAQPMIAPLKTASGWLFRARLKGYTRQQASAVCAYLEKDCMPVAPQY